MPHVSRRLRRIVAGTSLIAGASVVAAIGGVTGVLSEPTNPSDSTSGTVTFVSTKSTTGLGQTTAPVTELSGIETHSTSASVWWGHNDSGDSARIFAMKSTGATARIFNVSGVTARDWEDIEVVNGTMYVGDIGGPTSSPALVRFPEPAYSVSDVAAKVTGAVRIPLRYPGGASYDSEALLGDPVTGDIFLITKNGTGTSGMYQATAAQIKQAMTTSPASTITLTKVLDVITTVSDGASDVELLKDNQNRVTSADVSLSGSKIAVRTYTHTYVWNRGAGETIVAAMKRPGIAFLSRNAESVAFSADGTATVGAGEGSGATLYRYTWSEPQSPPTVTASATPESVVEGTAVTLTASASDAQGIAKLELLVDGTSITTATSGSASASYATTGKAGTHTLVARATDTSGASAEQSVTFTVTPPTTSSTNTLAATADTYIDSSSPNQSFGNATTMDVDADPAIHRALLRFNVPTVTGDIASAKLRVYALDASSQGPEVRQVTSAWNESTTYATRPTYGAVIDTAGAISSGSWVDYDVTSVVKSGSPLDVTLMPTSGDGLQIASSENTANRPQLLITTATTTVAPPTGTTLYANEFDGPAGQFNDTKWSLTDDPSNGKVTGYAHDACFRKGNVALNGAGQLAITARKESCLGKSYSSGDMKGPTIPVPTGTQKITMVARMKASCASGSWPAFWSTGTTADWPIDGEIDMVELYGNDNYKAPQNTHVGYTTSDNFAWPEQNRSTTTRYCADWHTYGVIWSVGKLEFTIDGNVTVTRTKADFAARGWPWPFDGSPQQLRLDLALGSYAGTVDEAALPMQMLVDWVRVTRS